MRDKKMLMLVMLITTAILFAGGCGNQTKPVNAEPTGTVKEAGTEGSEEESSEPSPSPSPSAGPEEGMGSSGAEDNSEKESGAAEEGNQQDSGYEIIPLEDTVMYAAADCDIRSGAGTQYDKAGSLSYAQEVTVNGKAEAGEGDLWYVIKTEDGSVQMVSAGMLRETKPAAQASSVNGSGSSGNGGGNIGETRDKGNSQTASEPSPTPKPEPVSTPAPASAPEPAPAEPAETPAPTPEPEPVHTHSWKEHYAEKQVWVSNIVWVPNIVVVEDYETQRVAVGSLYQCNCGFETTDTSAIREHGKAHALANEDTGFQNIVQYEEQQVLVGSHEEDHGHEEDQGHYETSSYIDYYYCDCGERK